MKKLMKTRYQPLDARAMLIDLGVGSFNTTMLIETMFMSPATTEASSAPVMVLVGHIQDNLNVMGAGVPHTGTFDQATGRAMVKVAGADFLTHSWADVVKKVVQARRAGMSLAPRAGMSLAPRAGMSLAPRAMAMVAKPAMSGLFDSPAGLPDVPGGLVTYLVGGALLWRALHKKRVQ